MKGSPVRVRASALPDRRFFPDHLVVLICLLHERAITPAPARAVVERGAQRLELERQRRLREAGGGRGAAPAPGERVSRHAGGDRVPGKVAGGPEQVLVALE